MGDVIGDLNSPPWSDSGHGGAQRGARLRQGAGAAVGDVRLCRRPSVEDPGPGQLPMVFDSYAEVPANVSKEIIAKATGQ